jgi:ATP-dependent DNA ligase
LTPKAFSALPPAKSRFIEPMYARLVHPKGDWIDASMVPQIEFTEWTPDGHLRHSKFVGLREDEVAR